MKASIGRGNLIKTGFVLLSIFAAVSVAWSADSSGKRAKQSATQPVAMTDPDEWKKVVEAAKKEGKIVISGPPGEVWGKSLVDIFQQEYPEIKVEYTAMATRNFWPRIRQERELGKKLWDIVVNGIGTSLDAKKDGLLAPVRPLLLPEIADSSKWIGGLDGTFSDREKKYLLCFLISVIPSAHVNYDFIKESDLKSTSQLLEPKFRGKIVMLTPTGGASYKSLGHMAFMYGEDFIRELLSKQEVSITDDDRQQVEWLVRGKYPIATGLVKELFAPFEKQGLGKNIMALEDKINRTTAGFAAVGLLEGAPHSNAAKVYVNWLLSQKTQTKLTQNIQHNSRRIDVPHVEAAVDPAKLSKYRDGDTEEVIEFNYRRYDPVIKEALKR